MILQLLQPFEPKRVYTDVSQCAIPLSFQGSSILASPRRKKLTQAVMLLVVAFFGFAVGFWYQVILTNVNPVPSPPYGASELIVDFITVNGPDINGGYFTSYCCSGCTNFDDGADRIAALNRVNPPVVTCDFRIGANSSGYLLLIIFNTAWEASYQAYFGTSSNDPTVSFVSMPACANQCTVGPVTAQYFRFGFAASESHDSSKSVDLSITVKGFLI